MYIYIYVYVCLSMIDYACMYIIYHVLPENGNQKQIHLKKMPGQCGRNAPRCQSTMTAPAQPRGESFRLHHHTCLLASWSARPYP